MTTPATRFLVRPEAIEGDRVRFDVEEARHLGRVLRVRPGDVVRALDGRGAELTVRVDRVGPHHADGTLLARRVLESESPLRLVLAQGLPKADKLDTIIRMATELGVARIDPLLTERTVVRRETSRLERWRRVAREATKQCGRAVVPEVSAPRPLPEWLAASGDGDLLVCLWEGETEALGNRLPEGPVARAALVVGPEGGLAESEVRALEGAGALVAGLGPRILRTETAGPVGVALLQARFGDLGRGRAI